MNLKQLRERGGFVSAKPVKKSVTWKQVDDLSGAGEDVTFDVWVSKLSFGMIESLATAPDRRSRNAALIAEAIRLGDEGKDALSYQDAYQLKPSLARALVIAIAEVNALPKPKEDGEGADDPKDLAH